MSFLDAIDYPKEQVVAFQDLEECIQSSLSSSENSGS